jgi:hypothetical protein
MISSPPTYVYRTIGYQTQKKLAVAHLCVFKQKSQTWYKLFNIEALLP